MTITRHRFRLPIAAVLLAAALAVPEVAATLRPPPRPAGPAATPPTATLAAARRLGPFATMRRANEVANHYRRQGCSALAFHNGDGYYVDVRC